MVGRTLSLGLDVYRNKKMIKWIKEAMALNEKGIKLPSKPKPTEAKKKELVVPDYFIKAMNKNKKAKQTFDAFSYSNKKDYIEWLIEAKTEETRNKRLT